MITCIVFSVLENIGFHGCRDSTKNNLAVFESLIQVSNAVELMYVLCDVDWAPITLVTLNTHCIACMGVWWLARWNTTHYVCDHVTWCAHSQLQHALIWDTRGHVIG